MEPATSARALCGTASKVVHHPKCGPIFVNIFYWCNLFSAEIYLVALKVCIGLKPEMHLKDDVRPLILVAAETQVDLQNRPEDQVLARQNTSGHKKRHAQSSRLRLGAADQPEDQNLLGDCITLKIFCIGQGMQ